jgi:hypothetical protein
MATGLAAPLEPAAAVAPAGESTVPFRQRMWTGRWTLRGCANGRREVWRSLNAGGTRFLDFILGDRTRADSEFCLLRRDSPLLTFRARPRLTTSYGDIVNGCVAFA